MIYKLDSNLLNTINTKLKDNTLTKHNFISFTALCTLALLVSSCSKSTSSSSAEDVVKEEAVASTNSKYNFNTESMVGKAAVEPPIEETATTQDNTPPTEQKTSTITKLKNIKEAPPVGSYLLQIGDTMDVKVRLNPELNEQVIVPPDGLVSTTIAEDVMAYGRTVKELRRSLTKQYAKELTDPRLSVILRSFAPNRVYVTGEVTLPGEFVTVGPSLTLLQAIARAGGLKNSANPDNIIVIRHKNGEAPVAYTVDYESAQNGTDPLSDAKLAAYDVVFVPRSGVADVYVYFQQFVQQFLPPSFGMSYQLNPQNNINR